MSKRDVKIRTQASEIRSRIGLNDISPVNIPTVFNSLSFSLVKRPMESSLSGAFLRIGRENIIFINTAKSLGHQNFTAAHELFHAAFDNEINSRGCETEKFSDGKRDQHEKNADLFASLFLLPEEAITVYLKKRLEMHRRGKPDLSDIIYLEQIFQVSHASMINRLLALKYISRHQCEEFKPDIRVNARFLGYPTDLYYPDNKTQIISSFAQKAREAYERNLISTSRYEELLYEIGIIDPLLEEEHFTENTPEDSLF